MQRVTKLSKQNLAAADRAELIHHLDMPRVFVKVFCGERAAFLWGAEDMLYWPNQAEALRFLRRHRPGLEVFDWGRPVGIW